MRLRVKRLMILALVAIGAIACFTAPGWISKIDFDKSVVEEQYLDIGIEYKDGWYLIKDADDYYKMCETVNSGIGDGLKYRLENDITISAGVSMNVFSGTLDGNGHEVSVDTSLEPTYKPDVNSGVEASGFYGGFVGAIGLGYGYLSPSWTEDACARYELNSSYTISGTWGSSIQYVGVGGVCGVLLGGMYNMYIKYPSSLTLSIPQHDNTYYGYLVGVAWSGSIWNCGVDISAGTTIKDKDGNKIDFKAFSGAYAKGDSSVKQCLLITNDIGKDAEPITSSSADDGQAIPAGIAGGGGVVRYEGCYQWYYGRTRVDYNRDKEMFPDLRVATTIDEILAGRAWTIIEGVNNGYIYPTALADLSDIEVTVTFKNVEEETYNDGGKRCFFRTSNQNDNTTHKNTYKYNKELGGWASCGTPVRYGYYFSHFNTSWDGSGTSYYSTSKVKSNLTLYPIFNPITTTFKYDANGGEGTTSDSTVTYGEEYFTFSKNEFTR